jgi:hypothetical protein
MKLLKSSWCSVVRIVAYCIGWMMGIVFQFPAGTGEALEPTKLTVLWVLEPHSLGCRASGT